MAKGIGLSLGKLKENVSINREAFKNGRSRESMLKAAEKADASGRPEVAQQWRDAAEQHENLYSAIQNNFQPQQQQVDENGRRITQGEEENPLAAIVAQGGNIVG